MAANTTRAVEKLKFDLKQLKYELEVNLERELESAAFEMTEKAKKRIVVDGRTAYTKKMGYKDKKHIRARQKAGLQTAYKDLYFTGAMMDSYMPQEPKSKVKGVISMTVDVADSQKYKVDGLSSQYNLSPDKTVVDPTEKENREAQNRVDRWIARLVKKYKLIE